MNNSVLVLVDSTQPGYRAYSDYIQPYLNSFGIPYIETTPQAMGTPDYALILVGQVGLSLPLSALREAVESGIGVVSVDPAIGQAATPISTTGSALTLRDDHYITALHNAEEIPLYAPLTLTSAPCLPGGEVLVSCGGAPILEVAGHTVLWHDTRWMSHSILGPMHGMDDLFWRSIVWAARKPFVLQGMPPMLGMRIDDVWGTWRETQPENPLLWVDIANRFGIKPWLGVFQDNVNAATILQIQKHTKDGTATAFPHAFAGCEWVASDLPEHFIYFDHFAEKPYSDAQMAENSARAKGWFDTQGIPISKFAVGHYYETGRNAIPYFEQWGCEFIASHMEPGTSYRSQKDWIPGGPYRLTEKMDLSSPRPVFYADQLPGSTLFNCVVEIRDVCGYEWAPNCNVARTVKNGITQVRRAFDSMAPATLFTHESAYIQRMSPNTWEASLAGITDAVRSYAPETLTMDDICRYVRARYQIKIACTEVDADGKLRLALTGTNDLATKCYVFEESNSAIRQSLATLPRVSGQATVTL